MTAYQKCMDAIRATFNEVYAEDLKKNPDMHIACEFRMAYFSAENHDIVTFHYDTPFGRNRKLRVNWSCCGSVAADDGYARVLGAALSKASELEKKLLSPEMLDLMCEVDNDGNL